MRYIELKNCNVHVYADHVDTIFRDGSRSSFWPMAKRENHIQVLEFSDAARAMGYVSAMQFGIEHEIAHSFLAEYRHREHSAVVWASAHGEPIVGKVFEDEEHVVNRMLKYLNTGLVDEDYGVLVGVFGGEGLPDAACALWRVLRGGG